MLHEAALYEKRSNQTVHCFLCSHHCEIAPGKFGFCGIRENRGGVLYSHVYGEVVASHVDPIEKKPLYHFYPASASYSIATVGCNFQCGFCQNWTISQRAKRRGEVYGTEKSPSEIVSAAINNKCTSISYTYTEPTIYFEFALDCAKLAKQKGLFNCFITNGYMTDLALEAIGPYLDACNVDLKSFSDKFYDTQCKAHLSPILHAIRKMKELGIWVELTTLLIPGENDSDEELKAIAEFIAGLGVEIPWHISRFHPDYRYLEGELTPIATMRKAREIGMKAGLRYIYLGNVVEGNNTCCYKCRNVLIERNGYYVTKYSISNDKCQKCNTEIDGVFATE